MLVGFYTVRLVLKVLGAEDYGIYQVVAGFVVMLGFLNNAMAVSSQRFFSFELGRGNYEQLKKTFSVVFIIYILIIIIFIILAESVGLWFVNTKLLIPPERIKAAQWVYQFSVLSFVFTLLSAPYLALVMAHEDMNVYTFVAIFEILLKLGIVFLLHIILLDKLLLYGILLCASSFICMMIYLIICKRKYQECKFGLHRNQKLLGEIVDYTLFDLLGAVAFICKTQGVTILLNQFFNPIVVAARSIANVVQSAITYFSYNFSVALRPQIIKSFAAKEKAEMFYLVVQGMKGTYFLMYLFIFPAILETPQLLLLWLKSPPNYAVEFSRLLLLDALIQSIGYPLEAVVQATGKIRFYRLVYFFFYVLNLPLSGLALLSGAPVYSVFIIAVFLTFITLVIQLIMACKVISLSLFCLLKDIILPLAGMTALSAVLPVFLHFHLAPGFLRLCVITAVSTILICVSMFAIGLNNKERKKLLEIISKKISKDG
jgi:O-antigen/teichoic acid export membrane protein